MFKNESAGLTALLEREKDNLLPMLSAYGSRYFLNLLRHTEYNVQLSSMLLERAVKLTGKMPEDLVLIDYGGGLGITGLLARLAGFGRIIYVDIYAPVVADAQKIAEKVGLQADIYLHGEMDRITGAGLRADVLVSRDVVEHIYHLPEFFNQCAAVPGLDTLVHNTSANIYNLTLKSYFNKIHFKAEYQNIRSKNDVKKGEAETGYFYARRAIIKEAFPDLKDDLVTSLTRLTRGYRHDDIIREVTKYREYGYFRAPRAFLGLTHYPNTCDPFTGNWAERLLTFEEYRSFSKDYAIRFRPGPYNKKRPFGVKRMLASILNFLLFRLHTGPWIWPSIVMEMQRKPGNSGRQESQVSPAGQQKT